MKSFIAIVILLITFSSCSKDNDENTNSTADYLGKWTLVKMSGSMNNSETVGSAMEWQEFYIFNENETFTKIRIRKDIQSTASGTYILKNIQNEKYLELTYPNESNIIGSCYGNLKEELYFSANNTLSSTWSYCDGPGLDYKKIIIY